MQKNIQDRILELKEYNPCIEIYGGKIIVNVKYKNGWNVINPKNENIQVTVDDDDKLKYFYYADVNTNINLILDEIENTITFNNSIEEKKKLLIDKIQELKTIFETEPIDVLKKLEFKYKKRYTKKINTENDENNEINKTDENE